MYMRTPLAIALTALLPCFAHGQTMPFQPPRDVPASGIGYRGPGGTGVFPDSDPPVAWNDNTGRNILWKAPTANWGHGMPIVVGNRVLAVSEPGWTSDWPMLECWDADTGRHLWRKEIDHLVCLPEADRQPLRDAWTKLWNICRKTYASGNKSRRFPDSNKAAGFSKAFGKQMAETGLQIDHWHWPSYGSKICCVGHTFPTPVSDGKYVWVATSTDAFACFDMDGDLRWIRHIPGQRGEFCRYGRSPLLYGDLLIADSGNLTRAINKHTGQLVWSHPQDAHTVTTPAIITIGKTDVLLVAGMKKAYRLPDGKPLAIDGLNQSGLMMLVRSDQRDTVFFSGGGQHGGWNDRGDIKSPAAVRFTLEGDTLKADVLWHGVPGSRRSTGGLGIVYHDGRVYHMGGTILDADTGALLGDDVPKTRHLLAIAGDRIYGSTGPAMVTNRGKADSLKQTYPIYGRDGSHTTAGPILNPPFEGETAEQWKATAGNALYPVSYSGVFVFDGDRIYLRTSDFIYCIGHATRDWPGDDAKLIAALKQTADRAVAAQQLGAASPRVRLLAIQALERIGRTAGSEAALRELMQSDAYPEIRGAAAAALDAADPDGKPGWTALRDALMDAEKTLRGGAWINAHTRLNGTIAGMGERGKAALVAEISKTKDPLLTRALLYAAGEAGWVDAAITATARQVVSEWRKGAGNDKHVGTGPVTYLCAAVKEPGVAQLLFDHRYGCGDNGRAGNLVHSTLIYHTPAKVRLKYAQSLEARTRTTNDGTVLRTDTPKLIQAIRGLHDMGAQAEPALTFLRKLAEDEDPMVKQTAAWAVSGIEKSGRDK